MSAQGEELATLYELSSFLIEDPVGHGLRFIDHICLIARSHCMNNCVSFRSAFKNYLDAVARLNAGTHHLFSILNLTQI